MSESWSHTRQTRKTKWIKNPCGTCLRSHLCLRILGAQIPNEIVGLGTCFSELTQGLLSERLILVIKTFNLQRSLSEVLRSVPEVLGKSGYSDVRWVIPDAQDLDYASFILCSPCFLLCTGPSSTITLWLSWMAGRNILWALRLRQGDAERGRLFPISENMPVSSRICLHLSLWALLLWGNKWSNVENACKAYPLLYEPLMDGHNGKHFYWGVGRGVIISDSTQIPLCTTHPSPSFSLHSN